MGFRSGATQKDAPRPRYQKEQAVAAARDCQGGGETEPENVGSSIIQYCLTHLLKQSMIKEPRKSI